MWQFYFNFGRRFCGHTLCFVSPKILITKPTRCTNFSNLFLEENSTCFGHFLCPSSGVFHCTHSKPVWHIPLLCVQWKTPDDGQRNCPKHVEFCSKNKPEKLVNPVGFIIRIYHDARSPERQIHLILLPGKLTLYISSNCLGRTAIFWVVTQRVVVIPYRRFGTTSRSDLQGSTLEAWIHAIFFLLVSHVFLNCLLRLTLTVSDLFYISFVCLFAWLSKVCVPLMVFEFYWLWIESS